MHDDGVFNDCQFSDQEFDDEIAFIDSQTSMLVDYTFTVLLLRLFKRK